MKERVYLDGAANMTPYEDVLKSIRAFYEPGINNPSSLHKEGVKASYWLNTAREDIAKILGCDSDEIFFVASSSEAISWVAKMRKIIAHPTSHHSVIEAQKDCNPKLIDKVVLSVPYYDSETGIKNNIEELPCDEIFLDLTASIGKEKINLHKMGKVTYACLSAHKFGGILGAGVLYIRKDVQQYIQPLIWGSQESNSRGGTENLPAIVAMDMALKINDENFENNKEKINDLMNHIIKNIPECKYNCSSNILNITFKNLSAQSAVLIFDKMGIAVSAGSACNSHSLKPSPTLLYRGYTKEEAMNTIRISLSIYNTVEECEKFIKTLKYIIDNFD